MDHARGNAVGGTVPQPLAEGNSIKLRSYQAEMVEESMDKNVIVAMDTGSGKTHIALSRTAAELEVCGPNQLVWFLAPSVTLCEQQCKVFQSNLPQYGVISLTGKDDVDHWTDQKTWDGVLNNIRVVVSTHQVLVDALAHGFVKMPRIALLIFDEAHHCARNHPANQIMSKFYMPLLRAGNSEQLPRVLGLSASPVMKANASRGALQIIEANMNAIAKSPKVNRSELMQFVHRPELQKVFYSTPTRPYPPFLRHLERIYLDYDVQSDPEVIYLLEQMDQGYSVSDLLGTAISKRKTKCLDQLKMMRSRSFAMFEELGTDPTAWYVRKCLDHIEEIAGKGNKQLLDWFSKEKHHLAQLLSSLCVPAIDTTGPNPWTDLSPKVLKLIDLLVAESSPDVTGLVFVEQRAWVAALGEILSSHPHTKALFNIGTFVGAANNSKCKADIGDLIEPGNQQTTLDDFRAGRINLILATSVLEEGIDISSCNLVICFEKPKNLKSFIQRRGRARKQKAKYVIFMDMSDVSLHSSETWEELEEEMKEAYLSDFRDIQDADRRESEREASCLSYRVASTGALLDSDNAIQHLHHFCSTLSTTEHVDLRPQFTIKEDDKGNITADVHLPLSVDPSVRHASSAQEWRTKRNAEIDAAFQAYKALHLAGLVNDHLLPVHKEQDEAAIDFQKPDDTPSKVPTSPPYDAWVAVAEAQQNCSGLYRQVLIEVNALGGTSIKMVLLTALSMPELPDLVMHWNETKRYTVRNAPLPAVTLDTKKLEVIQAISRTILASVFHSDCIGGDRQDALWLLAPDHLRRDNWDYTRLKQWAERIQEYSNASDLINTGMICPQEWGLAYHQMMGKVIVQSIRPGPVPNEAGIDSDLLVIRAPKRRDFLHRIPAGQRTKEAYTRLEAIPAVECSVSNLPSAYSIFALFIPSIIHTYEVTLIADALRSTILKPVSFETTHLQLLIQAVTASSTGEVANYQRLECLGDCILKFLCTTHLMAANLTWPENYLTGKKGKLVSNGFLARATLRKGLDRFILTKRFTGKKPWRPQFAHEVLDRQSNTPELTVTSSKLLADVVESLIGASYTVGGLPKAFLCMQTLLSTEPWIPIPEANGILYAAAPEDFSPSNLAPLERLVGYTFNKPLLLLEALTHPSYTGPHATRSYERLEFLGDAVLDYIITTRLYEHKPYLSHQKMHGIRTALANAAFLAFRMFETTIEEQRGTKPGEDREEGRVKRALWMYMRDTNVEIASSRDAAREQHKSTRDVILAGLRTHNRYPWHLFALNDAPKFLSDIVESVLGAIYIDSHGSMSACQQFVKRLGILDQLERILRDEVDCLHPKERLGILASNEKVKYMPMDETEDTKSNLSTGKYRIQVRVGEIEVGGVVSGLKRLNTETIAAWNACKILERRDCDDDVEIEDEEDEMMLTEEVDRGGVGNYSPVYDSELDEDWHDAVEYGIM